MKTITLDSPIPRGDTTITTVELRRPKAAELRGLNLTDVLQMDVAALGKLLPRITTPALTDADVGNLDPADLLQMGAAVSSFLLPRAVTAAADSPSLH